MGTEILNSALIKPNNLLFSPPLANKSLVAAAIDTVTASGATPEPPRSAIISCKACSASTLLANATGSSTARAMEPSTKPAIPVVVVVFVEVVVVDVVDVTLVVDVVLVVVLVVLRLEVVVVVVAFELRDSSSRTILSVALLQFAETESLKHGSGTCRRKTAGSSKVIFGPGPVVVVVVVVGGQNLFPKTLENCSVLPIVKCPDLFL